MSSSLNPTKLEFVGHFENNKNKERDIRKILHSGPGYDVVTVGFSFNKVGKIVICVESMI